MWVPKITLFYCSVTLYHLVTTKVSCLVFSAFRDTNHTNRETSRSWMGSVARHSQRWKISLHGGTHSWQTTFQKVDVARERYFFASHPSSNGRRETSPQESPQTETHWKEQSLYSQTAVPEKHQQPGSRDASATTLSVMGLRQASPTRRFWRLSPSFLAKLQLFKMSKRGCSRWLKNLNNVLTPNAREKPLCYLVWRSSKRDAVRKVKLIQLFSPLILHATTR